MSGFSENFGWRAGFGCPTLYRTVPCPPYCTSASTAACHSSGTPAGTVTNFKENITAFLCCSTAWVRELVARGCTDLSVDVAIYGILLYPIYCPLQMAELP